MDNLNWDALCCILTFFSVIIAVVAFFWNAHHTKKVETITKIDELFDYFYTLDPKNPLADYRKYTGFLSAVNRFSAAYNENTISKKLVRKRMSSFMIRQYDERMEKVIEDRRKQFNREDYYIQIKTMVKDLKAHETKE